MSYQAGGKRGRVGQLDKPISSTRLLTFSGNSNARLFFLQFTKQSQWDRPTEPATEAPTQVKSNNYRQKRQYPLYFFSKLCVEAYKDDDFVVVKGARLPSLGETQGLAQACQLASGSHHKNQGCSSTKHTGFQSVQKLSAKEQASIHMIISNRAQCERNLNL